MTQDQPHDGEEREDVASRYSLSNPLRYECEKCRAKPGQRCRVASGRATDTHAARWNQAAEAVNAALVARPSTPVVPGLADAVAAVYETREATR